MCGEVLSSSVEAPPLVNFFVLFQKQKFSLVYLKLIPSIFSDLLLKLGVIELWFICGQIWLYLVVFDTHYSSYITHHFHYYFLLWKIIAYTVLGYLYSFKCFAFFYSRMYMIWKIPLIRLTRCGSKLNEYCMSIYRELAIKVKEIVENSV